MATASELFINVCQQLVTKKVIELSDQQLVKLSRLYPPPTTQATPPLSDALSSTQHHSSSFVPLSFKPHANSFFSNSHPSKQ